MFTLHSDTHIVVLFLYVDDVILTGSSFSLLFSFIALFSHQFAMKDLGDLHFFLGVQMSHLLAGLLLSQHKYTFDLLWKFHLHTCKPIYTPMVAMTSLTLLDGE